MLVSYRWVTEFADINAPAEELARRLTFSGLEVEGIEHVGALSERIIVAEVVSKEPHPSRDKLSVVEVSTGAGTTQVVCGAPNCPGPGGRVVLAQVGAALRDITLTPRELGGVMSEGMLVSEDELGIGPDKEGILILNDVTDAPLGTPVSRALHLEDWIIDISVTPNRPDALGHRGIAREAAMLFDVPFSPPALPPTLESGPSVRELVTVEILNGDACPRYGAAVVSDVSIGPSPFSLRYRLHTLGIRPISNLVDVTNLILLEYGQPIHAFDLDRLRGSGIVVRRAEAGERMKTLDEVERVFEPEDLLICDREGPVAVAGVMGGLDTGVTESTRRVLIECAYFNPSGIRRTSKHLKLSSDSSYRFERGADPNIGPEVVAATAAMMVGLAGGHKAPAQIDCYPNPIEPKIVSFRPSRCNALIGVTVPTSEIRRLLTGLGAAVTGTDELLQVTVPTFRPDIEREVDLIEEVVRLRGFEDVPAKLPRIKCQKPERREFESVRRAKEILASLGLRESVSYSFVSKSQLELFHNADATVSIANPLSSERATMRTTLVPGLVENLKRAQSRFLAGIGQFEVARTFHDSGAELPREVTRAAAVMAGPVPAWVGEVERHYDFYDIKGVLEGFLFEYSGCRPLLEPSKAIAYLHPAKACEVLIDGAPVGVMGEIHPEILSSLKLPMGALVFEVEIEHLSRRVPPHATALPEFPFMTRDVALLVDETLDAGPIRNALESAGGELVEQVRIFDIYSGKGIPEGKKSLAFSIVYRASDRTLVDDEVDAVFNKAVLEVSTQFGAVRR